MINNHNQDLTAEQIKFLNSGTAGALLGPLYYGFMKQWPLFILSFLFFVHFFTVLEGILQLSLSTINLGVVLFGIFRSRSLAWYGPRNWDSFEQFQTVQKKWDLAGRTFLFASLIILLIVLLAFISKTNQ